MRRDWGKTLTVVLVVALIAAFGVGGYAAERYHQKQDVADAIASYYDSTRDTVKSLCDDPRNASKTECKKTPPPAKKITEAAENDKPIPTRYLPPDRSVLEPIVRSLLYAFCGYDGSCQGADGTDGKDGKNAPPVSASEVGAQVAAQIDAALVRNCGGSCVGPAGPDGPQGQTGAQGVGIKASRCDALGRFVLILTDDTEITVDGSRCRPFRDAG